MATGLLISQLQFLWQKKQTPHFFEKRFITKFRAASYSTATTTTTLFLNRGYIQPLCKTFFFSLKNVFSILPDILFYNTINVKQLHCNYYRTKESVGGQKHFTTKNQYHDSCLSNSEEKLSNRTHLKTATATCKFCVLFFHIKTLWYAT